MTKRSGSKPPKRPAGPPRKPPIAPGELSERVRTAIAGCITLAERRIAAGTASPALFREVAGLARAATTLDAEARAQEKAAAELSRERVVDWLCRLQPSELAALVNEVNALNDEGSLL